MNVPFEPEAVADPTAQNRLAPQAQVVGEENAIAVMIVSAGTRGTCLWPPDAAFVDFRQHFDVIVPTQPRFVTYFPYRT